MCGYDLIITTQEQFDDWLSPSSQSKYENVHSVLLVGIEEGYKRLLSRAGYVRPIILPSNLYRLDGANGAVIDFNPDGDSIIKSNYNSPGEEGMLIGYATPPGEVSLEEAFKSGLPLEGDYGKVLTRSISNITLKLKGLLNDEGHDKLSGFYNCENLANCSVELDIQKEPSVTSTTLSQARGFENCYNLTNCNTFMLNKQELGGVNLIGFDNCSSLFGCKFFMDPAVSGSDAAHYMGFNSCKYISGGVIFDKNPTSGSNYGFYNCRFCNSCTNAYRYISINWHDSSYVDGSTCPDFK